MYFRQFLAKFSYFQFPKFSAEFSDFRISENVQKIGNTAWQSLAYRKQPNKRTGQFIKVSGSGWGGGGHLLRSFLRVVGIERKGGG